ncbi:hypothetical protein JW916_04100 [Candidatus Sumerlaeota bacterium]|nr:hypothetical protein [Candidatus Sumerlaeota bacterium]
MRILLRVGSLLGLVLLGAFLVLPSEWLYLFGLGLLLVAAGTLIPKGRSRSLKTLLVPLGFFVAIVFLRFFFWPIGLAKSLCAIVPPICFLFASIRSKTQASRVALASTAVLVYVLVGLWAFDWWIPWTRADANASGPVVFLGDSLTAGLEDSETPDLYVSQMRQWFKTPLINAGVAGNESKDALQRLEADVLSKKPSVVVVMIGGNDILGSRPREEMKADVSAIVQAIKDSGSNVILMEIPSARILNRHEGVYREVARQHHAFLVSDFVLRRIYLFSSDGTLDGIHLNRKGHAIVARCLERILRNRFGVR